MHLIATKTGKRLIPSLSFFVITSVLLGLVILFTPASVSSAPHSQSAPPYPPSTLIDRIDWDFGNMTNMAHGSDLWPTTWGPDGHIYTSWGDGGGFGGTNSDGRVSIGFAKIEGSPENFTTTNIWGGKNATNPTQFSGKTGSILSVDGTLYAWINTQNRSDAPDFKMAWSSDLGAHWQLSPWSMNSNSFALASFINFGQDYQGARDGYVYSYGGRWGFDSNVYLARVPKESIANLNAYEYFSGLNGSGNPTWSSSAANRRPVFNNSNMNAFNGSLLPSITYNAALGRYLFTIPHGRAGDWGVYDAPEPWGPWTTVDYYSNWGGYSEAQTLALYYIFSSKWMSQDGLEMWMTFSGAGPNLDEFKLIKGTLVLSEDVPRITTQVSEESVTITSTSSEPSWKATFLKSKGGALWDLRIPADSPDNLIYNEQSPGIQRSFVSYGAFAVNMFRASDNLKYFSSDPLMVSRFEVIEQKPHIVRIAVEGVSNDNGFSFGKTITIVPSGIRVDGGVIPSTDVWHLQLPFNIAAGNLEKDDLELGDEDTGFVSLVMNIIDDVGQILPFGIDYPFSVHVPYKKDSSVSFKFSAIDVPEELADKRAWSAVSWGEHNPDGQGAFGVDHIGFTSGPATLLEKLSGIRQPQYPAGVSQNYAYGFQFGEDGEEFPEIPAPGDGSVIITPPDSTPPEIESAFTGPSEIRVVFNEPLNVDTAVDASNYHIGNGVNVLSVSMDGDDTVILATTTHDFGVNYTLTISGVADILGNAIVNAQTSYTLADIPVVSNIEAATNNTYRVAENLEVGDQIYTDRSYIFTDLPLQIIGSTYIMTPNNDKTGNQLGFLTFSVDRDVTVYIGYDDRALSLPFWLRQNQGWIDHNMGFSERELYSKGFDKGIVSIGGNLAPGASGVASNYSVFIVSQRDVEVNLSPVAEFTATPLSGEIPLTVNFDASESFDPDGSIVSYQWDFDDGSFGAGRTTSHTYNEAGNYDVILTVTDNGGDTDTEQVTINVEEDPIEPGVSLIVQNRSVDVGENVDVPIVLDEVVTSLSEFVLTFTVNDGTIATIEDVSFANFGLTQNQMISDTEVRLLVIDFEGIFQLGSKNIEIAVVELQSEREGTASLSLSEVRAKDSDGNVVPSNVSSGMLTVMNVAPEITINAQQGMTVDMDTPLEVTGSISDIGDTSWTATVDYGDGSGVSNLPLNGNNFTLSHTYANGGHRTIIVNVVDNDGAGDTATLDIRVRGGFPTLPNMPGPSQDLDLDGLAEDVNGNGRADFADVVVLFDNLESAQVQQNPESYDFNQNTQVDMADVIGLFEIVLN